MLKFLVCVTLLVSSSVSAGGISGRIFNGTVATEIAPYHAQLIMSNTVEPDGRFMGSGVLVSRIHVVTAALNILGFNKWEAGFGSLSFSDLTYFQATGAVVHEDYNATNTLNNIGVVFFGNGVFPVDDKNIAPIALSKAGDAVPASGTSGFFVSFGFQTPAGPVSNVLLSSTQVVMTEANCNNVFVFGTLTGQFCAIDLQRFTSPCAGEQGSAFVAETSDGLEAVGMVSATIGACDTISAVTFYIRFSDYRTWLSTRFGI